MKRSEAGISTEIWFVAVLFVLALAAAFTVFLPSAWASEGHGACKADIEKFCKNVKPGEGRIVKCLKEHQEELSPECQERGKAAKAKVRARIQALQEACRNDLEKFCAGAKAGGGRKIRCLKQHEAEVSADCKSALEKKHAPAEQK